ncbi:MAG: hypothetical protein HF982_11650 [Desulfobacteraceae bacterium]|nr:hypothetical protein [Desulfobacteraceae bacterium]MBC2720219.1 hypothetical protein [Desulfobacteraceae bacterium]
MLKKVMIICFAFSFVFIGGIAFASDGESSSRQVLEDQKISMESAHSSGVIAPPPDNPTDLITLDSKTIIGEGDELTQEPPPEEGTGEDDDGKK